MPATRIIHVRANTIRNGLGLARRHLGLRRIDSRELWRERVKHVRPARVYESELSNGTVVYIHLEHPWPRGKPMSVISVDGKIVEPN